MDTNQHTSEELLLSEGGPLHNRLVKMRLYNNQRKLAVLCLGITWLPIIIIAAIEGTLYFGTQLPFLKDVAMQVRLLVGLPMLILIKPVIDRRAAEVARYISVALMNPEEGQQIISQAFSRAKKLTDSVWTEIILLLIVIGAITGLVKGGMYSGLTEGTSSWMNSGKGANQTLSIAGYWAIFFSIPLYQFLFLRWIWRYIVWVMLLFQFSRARLNLLATHADRGGGLGIVVLTQRSFNLIFVAGSVVLSGELIAELIKNPTAFNTIRTEVLAYIIICIILILFPLLFFTGKLLKTKQQGLLHLSNLAAELSRKFENEWVNDRPIEKRIAEKEVDPSMAYDYIGVYESVQNLRLIPVTLRDIISMVIMLLAPFIPILIIHFSVTELLQRIVGLLL